MSTGRCPFHSETSGGFIDEVDGLIWKDRSVMKRCESIAAATIAESRIFTP
jgi:hypothetical protein